MKRILFSLVLVASIVACRPEPILAPVESEESLKIRQNQFVEEVEAVIESRENIFLQEYTQHRAMYKSYDYSIMVKTLREGVVPFDEVLYRHPDCSQYMRTAKTFSIRFDGKIEQCFLVLKECSDISWESDTTVRVKVFSLIKASKEADPFKTFADGGFFNIYFKKLK